MVSNLFVTLSKISFNSLSFIPKPELLSLSKNFFLSMLLTNSIELIEPYFASCDTESKSLSIDSFCFSLIIFDFPS